PDFTISANPTALTLVQGTSGPSTITTAVSGGFNSAVALTASGVPTGASVTFNPTSIAAPGSGSSTATITAGAPTPAGSYTSTITGRGGATTHSARVSLPVTTSGGGGGGSELVVDGGFESATASGNSAPGWTATPSPSHNEIIKGGSYPHAGTAYAEL